MIGISTEAKVGLLVILAIFILAFLTFRAGNYKYEDRRGYSLKVIFSSVAGLDQKARVNVSGVDSGFVENISIVEGGAQLILRIKEGVPIRKNAIARIQSLGLMGEKYVEIEPGREEFGLLEDGDWIKTGLDAKDIDYLTEQMSALVDDLLSITHSVKHITTIQEGQARLTDIINNLQNLTLTLTDIAGQNQEEINMLVRNLANFSDQLSRMIDENRPHIAGIMTDLNDFSSNLSQKGNKMVNDLETLTEGLANVLDPNTKGIGSSLERLPHITHNLDLTLQELYEISEKLNKGEGTIGKLLTDDKVYEEVSGTLEDIHNTLLKAESFKLYLAFRSEYLTEYDKSKSYFSLEFVPRLGKYYRLEFVDDFEDHVSIKRMTYDEAGNVKSVEKESEDKLLISLLMARKIGPFYLKGGLIESKGGIGVDYFPFGDDLYFGVEGWDFDDKKPHLKLFARFIFKKYFFLSAGWDNIINSKTDSFFAGAGFTFEDNDLKYLITKLPLPGL